MGLGQQEKQDRTRARLLLAERYAPASLVVNRDGFILDEIGDVEAHFGGSPLKEGSRLWDLWLSDECQKIENLLKRVCGGKGFAPSSDRIEILLPLPGKERSSISRKLRVTAECLPRDDDCDSQECLAVLSFVPTVAAGNRKRELQQEAVVRLGQLALENGLLDELFDQAVRELSAHLNVRMAKLMELMPGGNDLFVRAGIGWHEGIVGQASVHTGRDSQAGFTLEQSETVVVRDFAHEERFTRPALLAEHGVMAGASVIIGPLERPWGVLGAHDPDIHACAFDEDDINFMRAIANTLWLAIAYREAWNKLEDERRELRQFINAMPLQLSVISPEQRYTLVNEYYRMWGRNLDEVEGAHIKEVMGEENYRRALPRIEGALAGEVQNFEIELEFSGGGAAYNLATYVPRRNGAGELDGFYVASLDITDRKRQEERYKVISHELDHRVKNILSLVNSIARLSGRNAESIEEYRQNFEERIQALARAHQTLAESRWDGMSMRQLVENEVQPYTDENDRRLTIQGDDVLLTALAAQPVALVVHELATNAAKYGALRLSEGRLALNWRLEQNNGETCLRFEWTEKGMKDLEPPKRKGFGSTVITRAVEAQCDAKVKLEFGSTGLNYVLVLPKSCLFEQRLGEKGTMIS